MVIEHKELASEKTLLIEKIFTRPLAEGSFHRDIKHLLTKPKANNSGGETAHFGIGGLRNLDIAAQLKPDMLILADINKIQLAFWKLFGEVIINAATSKEFTENLANNMFRVHDEYARNANFNAENLPIELNQITAEKRAEFENL